MNGKKVAWLSQSRRENIGISCTVGMYLFVMAAFALLRTNTEILVADDDLMNPPFRNYLIRVECYDNPPCK